MWHLWTKDLTETWAVKQGRTYLQHTHYSQVKEELIPPSFLDTSSQEKYVGIVAQLGISLQLTLPSPLRISCPLPRPLRLLLSFVRLTASKCTFQTICGQVEGAELLSFHRNPKCQARKLITPLFLTIRLHHLLKLSCRTFVWTDDTQRNTKTKKFSNV